MSGPVPNWRRALRRQNAVVICDQADAEAIALSWGALRVVDIDQPPLPDIAAQVLERQSSDGFTP